MSSVQHRTVKADDDGVRLDRWFRKYFAGLTHGRLEKLLRQGRIRLDGARAKASDRLKTGQQVRIPPEVPRDGKSPAPVSVQVSQSLVEGLRNAVIHRDHDLLIINKPSGLAVQGGSKTNQHVDGALPELTFGAPETPRLVHRLDRDTSGLLVLARNRKAAQFLTRQFADQEVEKIYWALVYGVPRPSHGTITAPLAKRAAADGGERVVPVEHGDPDGMRAITDFAEVARVGQRFAWVAFRPRTGRTHQIRAHATAMGHPLVGDGKYRSDAENADHGGLLPKKLHLHARSIKMPHPAGGMFSALAPLRDHMADTWDVLGFDLEDGLSAFAEEA